jgi:protein phosphatase
MSRGPHKFESGAATNVGCVRRENEDAFLVLPERGVFAVADGMGGHEAGAEASAAVVDSLRSLGEPATVSALLAQCKDRLSHANDELFERAGRRGADVIGATVAAVLACEGFYACVWSGDSRIYLVRRGAIRQVSRDHTEVSELVSEGVLSEEEARIWPRRNIVTRAVGACRDLDVEVAQGVLEKDDIFVVCSDGLTAHVDDSEILACTLGNAPQRACEALVALTMQRGATDNVTAVVARYVPRGSTIVLPQATPPAALWEKR